eukprot:gene9272-1359_t
MNPYEYYVSCFDTKSLDPLFKEENFKKYEKFKTTSDNLKLKENGEILCGTPEQFVHFMVNPSNTDYLELMKKFLLIYESILTGEELLIILRLKYNQCPKSNNLSVEEFQNFYTKELSVIRLRISQFCILWVSDIHFPEDLIPGIQDFCEEMKQTQMNSTSQKILKNLSKKKKTQNSFEQVILDKNLIVNLLTFQDASPKEITEQLTLISFEQFQKIHSFEFLQQNRTKQKTNLNHFIQFSNTLSYWVSTMILNERNLDDRIEVICKFINVANEAYKMNNFSLIMGILPGINANSIFRLKKTFSHLPKEEFNILMKLKGMCSPDNGFKGLRSEIKKAIPPTIPFIGIYLTDLTFIEDGNKDMIDSLINWSKKDLYAQTIRDIQFFQQENYKLKPNSKILKYLSEIDQIAKDPDELYEESLLIEPRHDSEVDPDSVEDEMPKKRTFSMKNLSLRKTKSLGNSSHNLKKFSTPTLTPTLSSGSSPQHSPRSNFSGSPLNHTTSNPLNLTLKSRSGTNSNDITPNISPRFSNSDVDSDTDSSGVQSTSELLLDVLEVSIEEHNNYSLKETISNEIGKRHLVEFMKKHKQHLIFLDFVIEYTFLQELPNDSVDIKPCAQIISDKFLADSTFVRLLMKKDKEIFQYIEEIIPKIKTKDLMKQRFFLTVFDPIYEILGKYISEIYDEFSKSETYLVMIEEIQDAEYAKKTIQLPIEGPLKQYLDISEETQVLSLIKKMRSKKNGISGFGKKFLYQLKYYENCFKGTHLVAWLKNKYNLKSKQAILVGEQLLNECYLHHIGDVQPFLNNDTLYRFHIDDNSKILNTHRKFNGIPFSAVVVSQKIQKSQIDIQNKFSTKQGVDYHALKNSDDFKEFLNLTVELQSLSIDELTEKEKKCFFINIYNSLLIHVFLIHGSYKNQFERSKFFTVYKYDIGGFLYSLNDIKHGILRSNSPGPHSPKSTYFAKNDKRLNFILQKKDPRIIFSLVSSSKSTAKIRCFDPTNLEIGLNLSCSNFLDQEVSIVKSTLKMNVLLKWYFFDFGKTNEEVCQFILSHITENELKKNLAELMKNPSNIKMKYKSYNWNIRDSSEIF